MFSGNKEYDAKFYEEIFERFMDDVNMTLVEVIDEYERKYGSNNEITNFRELIRRKTCQN